MTGHGQYVKQAHADDQPGQCQQSKSKAEGRRVKAKNRPAKHHITDVDRPGHRRQRDKRQVMAAIQALADKGRTQHDKQAEGHKQVNVACRGKEQRAMLVTNRRAHVGRNWPAAGAIKQSVPGVAQGQQPDQRRHQGQPQHAAQRNRPPLAVDVLPEEHGPEGRHGENPRPGHGRPQHLALRPLRRHLQGRRKHPPERPEVEHKEAALPGKMPLTTDPGRQKGDPQTHRQGQQHRGRQGPAGVATSHSRHSTNGQPWVEPYRHLEISCTRDNPNSLAWPAQH